MKKQKFNLKDIKVQSFITSEETQNIFGASMDPEEWWKLTDEQREGIQESMDMLGIEMDQRQDAWDHSLSFQFIGDPVDQPCPNLNSYIPDASCTNAIPCANPTPSFTYDFDNLICSTMAKDANGQCNKSWGASTIDIIADNNLVYIDETSNDNQPPSPFPDFKTPPDFNFTQPTPPGTGPIAITGGGDNPMGGIGGMDCLDHHRPRKFYDLEGSGTEGGGSNGDVPSSGFGDVRFDNLA